MTADQCFTQKVEYPAVLVLDALRTDPETKKRRIVCFPDGKVLEDDTALGLRLHTFRTLEQRGALPYTYTLANVDDVDRVLAQRRAEREAELNPGNREAGNAPPASNDSGRNDQEPTRPDDSTESPESQDIVVMTVRYQGTGSEVVPTGSWDGATADLVDYRDTHGGNAPGKNVKRVRDYLRDQGYAPDYPQWEWLDRGDGPRRRREVYRRNGANGKSMDLWAQLRQFAVENPLPRTPQDERRMRYREMALAGEQAFAACQDCPHLQDCPYDWRACDRKAARAKAANREIQRPRSSQNSTFAAYTTG